MELLLPFLSSGPALILLSICRHFPQSPPLASKLSCREWLFLSLTKHPTPTYPNTSSVSPAGKYCPHPASSKIPAVLVNNSGAEQRQLSSLIQIFWPCSSLPLNTKVWLKLIASSTRKSSTFLSTGNTSFPPVEMDSVLSAPEHLTTFSTYRSISQIPTQIQFPPKHMFSYPSVNTFKENTA